MAVSKVVYGGNTLIDLTNDSVVADKLLSGYTAHGADGEAITGTCGYDADTQDATAKADEILITKTAYVRGSKMTGSMPNNGAVSGTIDTVNGIYTVPQGYHDGSGSVGINADEKAKLIPGNIKQGITILGVVGSHEGSDAVTAEPKTVTPSTSQQVITPSEGYDYLSQVTVAAIPYAETENSAGGMTVTIG